MKIQFVESTAKPAGVFIIPVGDDKKLSPAAVALDKQAGGALSRALSGKFTGKFGQCVSSIMPKNAKTERVFLLGYGSAKKLDLRALENLGGAVVPFLNGAGIKSATFIVEPIKGMNAKLPEAAAHIASGVNLR